MLRAKPKKRNVDKVESMKIVQMTNYLNFAALVRTLVTVYDWDDAEVAYFMEAYLALIDEIYDNRQGVGEFIRDTKELTGIDVRTLIDSALVGGGKSCQ